MRNGLLGPENTYEQYQEKLTSDMQQSMEYPVEEVIEYKHRGDGPHSVHG
jgi:hypothetical protein